MKKIYRVNEHLVKDCVISSITKTPEGFQADLLVRTASGKEFYLPYDQENDCIDVNRKDEWFQLNPVHTIIFEDGETLRL